MLLTGHRDAGDVRGGYAGLLQPGGDGGAQRLPPHLWIGLAGPRLARDDMRGTSDGEQLTGGGVNEGRLGGLGGAVHADDDGTRRHGLPHSRGAGVRVCGCSGCTGVLVSTGANDLDVLKTNYAIACVRARGVPGFA